MSATVSISTELHICTCTCGGVYAITEAYRANAHKNAGHWTCPYCRGTWGFSESEADRLKSQLAAAEKEKERLSQNVQFYQRKRDEALAEADHFRKSRDGVRGAMARERKRVSKGVCPCCNRQFADLHRHMTTKHPTFSEQKPENPKPPIHEHRETQP